MAAKRRARGTVSIGGAAVRRNAGKAPAGKVMSPSAEAQFAALAAIPEAREPRPYKTRRIAALALALLVVAIGAVMAVPQTRAAILEFFHLRG